jgi:guanylate kinase
MNRQAFHELLPELKKGYKPSPGLLRHLEELTLLMIIGPSAVGKSTIMKNLPYHYVPSDTTRAQTSEEVHGQDYLFRRDYQKIIGEIRAGQFVQFIAGPAGEFYGTKDKSYPKAGVAMLAVIAEEVKNFRGIGFKQTISAFIAPPSYEEWMRRLDSYRNLTPEKRSRRLAEGRKSIELSLNDPTTHFILNDEVDIAARQIRDLVHGIVNAAREEKARQAAKEMLEGIN